jgi:quinol monooxygenase YgiN
MSLHFLAAVVGALVAMAGTGVLVARCLRTPNGALVTWTVALFGLTVALAVQALGFKMGFGPIAFRAMELGAQVLAPLALSLGLAELAGKSIVTRFAARLLLSALAIVSVVIFASDPLSAAPFSKAWPSAGVYYQIVPNKLLEYVLAPATVIVALLAMGFAAARPGRDPAWRDALPAVGAAGIAALLLAVPGVVMLLGLSLSLSSLFVLLCVVAALGTWLAGVQVSRLALDVLREDAGAGYGDQWAAQPAWASAPATGDFDPVDDDEFGIYRGNGSRGQRDDLGYGGGEYGQQPPFRHEGEYPGAGGYARDSSFPNEAGHLDGPLYRDEAGYPGQAGYREDASTTGYQNEAGRLDGPLYRDGAGYPGDAYPGGAEYPGEAGHPLDSGGPLDTSRPLEPGDPLDTSRPLEPGDPLDTSRPLEPGRPLDPRRPADALTGAGRPAAVDRDEQANLFGQIAIYTLLEDRVEDFDRLTRQVVRQVRTHEPDTLVYIVHAVPSAPMQRILYEVYRDRTAYELHKQQPYVIGFEADRRPYVLATNIIELGLQQAKVSPLPSVSDLLNDSGFDLLSDTGFGQPGYGPRPAGGMSGGGAHV